MSRHQITEPNVDEAHDSTAPEGVDEAHDSTAPEGYALFVGERDHVLSEALSAAIPVVRCPQSSSMGCPAMASKPCPVRQNARVTVVFVPTDADEQRRLTCIGAVDAPVVAVVEGSTIGPIVTGDFAVVGDGSGAMGVLGAISGVIEGEHQRVDRPTTGEGVTRPKQEPQGTRSPTVLALSRARTLYRHDLR